MPPYGPPPDPSQVLVPSGPLDAPMAWAVTVLVGVVLCVAGRRSSATLVAGLTLLLTAPAFGMIPTAVWGAWPTIDKAGSLHFYGLGAHFHALDTSAPATQLIGVSMGHLWVTALFDVVLTPFAAMNAQALLNVGLGWWVASRLVRAAGADERWSLVAAFPMGLGLHVFRDVTWYTIEKTGTWPLSLYLLVLLRAARGGPAWGALAAAAYAWAFFYNAYWGVLGALAGALLFAGAGPLGDPTARRLRLAVALSALGGVPFLALQLPALQNAQLPAPAAFAERAALDVFAPLGGDGFPPNWNRLELWRALDLVVTGAALVALVHAWGRRAEPAARRELALGGAILVVLGLALGPATPLWRAFAALPGMWRFAKPETFVHLAVLGSAVLAGRELSRTGWRWWVVLVIQVGLWFALTRTHGVYPLHARPPG